MNTATQPKHLGTFIYHYRDGPSYRVTATDDTNLHWLCVDGEEAGREANEQVSRFAVTNDVQMLSWVEADGLVVTQTINFTTGAVYCVLVTEGQRIVLQGTITRSN